METTNPQTNPTEEKQRQIMQIENDNTLWFDNRAWSVMKEMAREFQQSGALPKTMTVQQALMAIQAGREIGMMPVAALTYIAFVNGRATLYGDGAIMQVVRAGHKVEFTDCTDKTASCKITRRDDGRFMEATFTMEMAVKRGLTAKGGPWITAPENMLKFKAFHMIAKFIVPDALHGMGIYEVESTEIEGATVLTFKNEQPAVNDAPKSTKLKPLSERVAEQKKDVAVEGEVVHQTVHQPTVNAAENPPEPVYEPITPPEPPVPVIQVASPLPPPKPTEGVAARRMREAAEKTKASVKSSNDF
jgi:hypothetical protein